MQALPLPNGPWSSRLGWHVHVHTFPGVPFLPLFSPHSPILNIDDVFKALMVYDETGEHVAWIVRGPAIFDLKSEAWGLMVYDETGGQGCDLLPHSHTPSTACSTPTGSPLPVARPCVNALLPFTFLGSRRHITSPSQFADDLPQQGGAL